jgi:hypothetical protein
MGMDSGGDNGLELDEEEAEVVEVTAQTQESLQLLVIRVILEPVYLLLF